MKSFFEKIWIGALTIWYLLAAIGIGFVVLIKSIFESDERKGGTS